jgi:hypothetical protein
MPLKGVASFVFIFGHYPKFAAPEGVSKLKVDKLTYPSARPVNLSTCEPVNIKVHGKNF